MPGDGMEQDSIRTQVRAFVLENFLFGREPDFADDESFIGMGILDSTGVLELVAFVETTFEIQVEDHELAPENLDSIDVLSTYIRHKQSPN